MEEDYIVSLKIFKDEKLKILEQIKDFKGNHKTRNNYYKIYLILMKL